MIREAIMAAMMNNKGGEANGEAMESNSPDVNKIKTDWNDFLSWMEQKGVKGKPELDKGDLGNKYFKDYIKSHPETSLSEKAIPIIRQEYVKLRDDNAARILAGKGEFTLPDVGVLTGEAAKKYMDRFMGNILKNEQSANPNYVGQYLTQTPFPPSTFKVYENDKLISEKTQDTYTAEDMEKRYKDKQLTSSRKSTNVANIPTKNTPIANAQKQ